MCVARRARPTGPFALAASFAVAACVCLLGPGAALAATAGLAEDGADRYFFFEADPGEVNGLTVRRETVFTGGEHEVYSLYDGGAQVTPQGDGCTSSSDGHAVTCPADGVTAIQLVLGDENDQVTEFFNIEAPAAMYGGPGDDRLIAGRGPAELYGEEGSDSLDGNMGDDYLDGGEGDDSGDAGNPDTLYGSFIAGLEGGRGDDTLRGGAGDDHFWEDEEGSGGGDDDIAGGDGVDSVSYQNRTADLSVTLDDEADDGEAEEYDNVGADIEKVIAGYGHDLLIGNDEPNVLSGWPGDDVIVGEGGSDDLRGDPSAIGSGDDQVFARDGEVDSVSCADGVDFVEADAEDQLVHPFGCESVDVPAAAPPAGDPPPAGGNPPPGGTPPGGTPPGGTPPQGGTPPANAPVAGAAVQLAVTTDAVDFARAAGRGGARKLARKGAFKAQADVPTGGVFEVRTTVAGKARASRTTVVAKASEIFSTKASETVTVKLTKAGKRTLRRVKRRVKLKVTVSFTPTGGSKVSESKTVTLKR